MEAWVGRDHEYCDRGGRQVNASFVAILVVWVFWAWRVLVVWVSLVFWVSRVLVVWVFWVWSVFWAILVWWVFGKFRLWRLLVEGLIQVSFGVWTCLAQNSAADRQYRFFPYREHSHYSSYHLRQPATSNRPNTEAACSDTL